MKLPVKDYSQCASRLELRGQLPPHKETVDAMIDGMLTSGVEAVIHSAVSQAGQLLFPSCVFPHCHPEASMGY